MGYATFGAESVTKWLNDHRDDPGDEISQLFSVLDHKRRFGWAGLKAHYARLRGVKLEKLTTDFVLLPRMSPRSSTWMLRLERPGGGKESFEPGLSLCEVYQDAEIIDVMTAVRSLWQRGLLDRIRLCDGHECGTWYFAPVGRQRFCSDGCRGDFYGLTPEGKHKRRDYMTNYRHLGKWVRGASRADETSVEGQGIMSPLRQRGQRRAWKRKEVHVLRQPQEPRKT